MDSENVSPSNPSENQSTEGQNRPADSPAEQNTQEQNAQKPSGQNYEFTAEIQKLLDILIHSLYTHKEVFLRELVSNASDALDKVRFLKLTGKPTRDPDLPLEIRIQVDKEKKIITISDTGIGMTREELVENIGTIAHSGSKSFLQKLAQNQENSTNLNLIGQFGVGFYSVFMVAKQVEILTLSANPETEACLWTSEGNGHYIISSANKTTRGTEIKIYLKETDVEEYKENFRIKDTIQKYSDFVSYPIYLDNEQINKLSAIWHRSPNEVKEEEYKEHYNYLTHTSESPLLHIHLSVDAPIQFRAILYIPSTVPMDIRYDIPDKWHSIHLYARRVFIQSDCEQLLPQYMRFVRGIVDSDDLPLNISRETLQENSMIEKIKNTIVRKVLERVEQLNRDNPVEYEKFWKNFGKLLKYGYRNDFNNRERLANLYRFNTSLCTSPDEWVSLDKYVDRMRPGQTQIYYLSGDSNESIVKSPHLEQFRKKNIEVLYLTEDVDDFLMQDLDKFKGKELVSADKENISLDEVESPKEEEEKTETPQEKVDLSSRAMEDFLSYLKDLFKEHVSDVRISKRLSDSPCCLVAAKDGVSLGMQKFYKRIMNDKFTMPKRILEINQDHPFVRRLALIYSSKSQEAVVSICCNQLLDNAMIMDGSLEEVRNLVPRTQALMDAFAKHLTGDKDEIKVAETKPASEPEAKPASEPEVKPTSEPEVKPASEPEAKPTSEDTENK